MANPVSKRFLECVHYLKDTGLIRSHRQFALGVNYLPQNLGEIIKGRRDAPVELIRKAVEKYDFNPTFLFTGKGAKIGQSAENKRTSKLTVVTDQADSSKIIFVAANQELNYLAGRNNPAVLGNFPLFNLPDPFFETGDHRCFEVQKENMLPILQVGDLVVATFVEPFSWETFIKEGMLCVVVTTEAVYINTLINQLSVSETLVLTSENSTFTPFIVPLSDIAEIWIIQRIIRKDLTSPAGGTSTNQAAETPIGELMTFFNEKFMDLEEILNDQNQSILEIQDKLEENEDEDLDEDDL